MNNLYFQEIKSFFRKYLSNLRKLKHIEQNKMNPEEDDAQSHSESDSNSQNIQEFYYHELNNIYLKCYENLKQFYLSIKDIKGLKLEGNKILENISLDQFNELFLEYGKGIKKRFRKQVLNYFYPNDNIPKLMGQNMELTPIPVKRQIYMKNEAEKKDFKNAERTAVTMRRLEYTHGLENMRQNDDKIFFYLMKGAVLIIEDWWIKILENRKNQNLKKMNKNNINNNVDDNKNNEIYNVVKNSQKINKNSYIVPNKSNISNRTVNYVYENKRILNKDVKKFPQTITPISLNKNNTALNNNNNHIDNNNFNKKPNYLIDFNESISHKNKNGSIKNLKKAISTCKINPNSKELNKKPKLIKLLDSNNISTTKVKKDKKYNLKNQSININKYNNNEEKKNDNENHMNNDDFSSPSKILNKFTYSNDSKSNKKNKGLAKCLSAKNYSTKKNNNYNINKGSKPFSGSQKNNININDNKKPKNNIDKKQDKKISNKNISKNNINLINGKKNDKLNKNNNIKLINKTTDNNKKDININSKIKKIIRIKIGQI